MATIRRVLILSIKAGAGHLRAAQAIEAVFAEQYPEVEVEHLDALEYTNAAFRKSFTEGYETLARDLPTIWGKIYSSLEERPAKSTVKRVAAVFDRLNARPLRRAVRAFQPDAVVCTHYMPAEVVGRLRRKGKLAAPVYVTLTDYDIHTMWLQDGVDHYTVATEEMAYALDAKGLDGAQVHVTGIPIMPVFSTPWPGRAEMRERLGLRVTVPTLLVSAGGFGLFHIDRFAEELAARVPDVQFLAVAGRNKRLRRGLEKVARKHPDKILPFGFVDNMHELMAASDFAVAKCGGLTTSECLAMGLPMVIIKPVPGQEERNAAFLLESGAGLWAHTAAHMIYKVERLLAAPDRVAQMAAAARAAARAGAAYEVVRVVMGGA